MTWDSQNRLTSCVFNGTTSTFKYGADGLRRQAIVGGVTTDYVYDGSTLIRGGFASGGILSTVKATYLTGPRGPEYRRDDTATELDSQGRQVSKCRWYVYDGLGSVVGEVDPSGNLTSSPKYDVYGLVRQNPGTASSAMGFVGGLGHLSEASTGLIYMKARYYDPSLGRFVSQDPGFDGNNWFIYCGDNPVNAVDRTGKSGEGASEAEDLIDEIAENIFDEVDTLDGVKAQEKTAEGFADWAEKTYERFLGKDFVDDSAKAFAQDSPEASADEEIGEAVAEEQIGANEAKSAAGLGNSAAEADEADAELP